MLKFDFFLPKEGLLIEFDGPQHYGHLRIGKYTLKKKQYKTLCLHDKIKDMYATRQNLRLVRIPYWDFGKIESLLPIYL